MRRHPTTIGRADSGSSQTGYPSRIRCHNTDRYCNPLAGMASGRTRKRGIGISYWVVHSNLSTFPRKIPESNVLLARLVERFQIATLSFNGQIFGCPIEANSVAILSVAFSGWGNGHSSHEFICLCFILEIGSKSELFLMFFVMKIANPWILKRHWSYPYDLGKNTTMPLFSLRFWRHVMPTCSQGILALRKADPSVVR